MNCSPTATVPFPIVHSWLASSSAYAPLCLAIDCANVVTATVQAHLWCRCRSSSSSRSRSRCSCSCSFLDATSSSITPNCHQLSVVIGQGIARPRPTRPGQEQPRLGLEPCCNFHYEHGTRYVVRDLATCFSCQCRTWRWRWSRSSLRSRRWSLRWFDDDDDDSLLMLLPPAHFVIIFMWENVVVVVVVDAASENDLRRGRSLINFNWLCWAGFHFQTLRASTSCLLQLLLLLVVVVALLPYCKIAST